MSGNWWRMVFAAWRHCPSYCYQYHHSRPGTPILADSRLSVCDCASRADIPTTVTLPWQWALLFTVGVPGLTPHFSIYSGNSSHISPCWPRSLCSGCQGENGIIPNLEKSFNWVGVGGWHAPGCVNVAGVLVNSWLPFLESLWCFKEDQNMRSLQREGLWLVGIAVRYLLP